MSLRDEFAHLLHDPESMSLEIERQYYEKTDAIIALFRERMTSDEAVNAAMKWIYSDPWELARDSQKHVVRSSITAALDAVIPSEAKEHGDGLRRS